MLVRTKNNKWIVILPQETHENIFVDEEPEAQQAVERALQNLIVMSESQLKFIK